MALQSVYLPSEVTHLVTLSRKEKEKQLIELMSIVAGIRLFNKDCKRGGDGIEHCIINNLDKYFLYSINESFDVCMN